MIYIILATITFLVLWICFLKFYTFKETKNGNFILNKTIIINLRDSIKDYVNYEAEHGMLLPKEFKADPAAWLNVLRSIEYSFDELYEEYSEDYFLDKMSQEDRAKREEKIQKGLELFGKYLRDLN